MKPARRTRPTAEELTLAVVFLALIAFTHLGYEVVHQATGLDRAAVFYVARGLEGAFLYALFMGHSPYVAAVALWGVVESAMTSICGALYIIEPVNPGAWQGLCDVKTGMPVFYYSGLIIACLLALSIAIRRQRV